jgi:hypothetical protein
MVEMVLVLLVLEIKVVVAVELELLEMPGTAPSSGWRLVELV